MPVTPREAVMMQTAKTTMLGRTTRGRPASFMKSAAARNEKAWLVGRADLNGVAGEGGVTVTRDRSPRRASDYRVYRRIVGQYNQRAPLHMMTPAAIFQHDNCKCGGSITIGEALEAVVLTVGRKPMEWSDAAAIQAGKVRATGRTSIVPDGVAASAQSITEFNSMMPKHEDKTKLAYVLMDAASRLPLGKATTSGDAEGVTGVEMRNDLYRTPHPVGVATSIAAAALFNQEK